MTKYSLEHYQYVAYCPVPDVITTKEKLFFRDHFAIGFKHFNAKLTTRFIISQEVQQLHSGKPTPLHSNYLNQCQTITFTTTWNIVVPFTNVTA